MFLWRIGENYPRIIIKIFLYSYVVYIQIVYLQQSSSSGDNMTLTHLYEIYSLNLVSSTYKSKKCEENLLIICIKLDLHTEKCSNKYRKEQISI